MSLDLKDRKQHPDMTHWFSLSVLWTLAKHVFIAGLFGNYADRRLIQASLDPDDQPCDFSKDKNLEPKDELWIDYVADVGDGFDSTYAIAYLLGQQQLTFNGKKLPRGDFLIMGGDEVYPEATKENYKIRLEAPYCYAFPYQERVSAADDSLKHPYVFLIPGNHDWYDGLTLFLAKFCRGNWHESEGLRHRDYAFANSSWQLYQRRSYFAIKLPKNWWVFSLDTQLGENIDQAQHDYFKKIVEDEIKNGNVETKKIIICSSVPSWLYVDSADHEKQQQFHCGIRHFVEKIINVHWKNKAKIYAVISGDSHHYNRYESNDKTQFITAGGGGAFLHPTHQLEEEIFLKEWLGNDPLHLDLKNCYPDKSQSLGLAWQNIYFSIKNWEFTALIGVVYAVIALFLTRWSIYNPQVINPNCNWFNYLFYLFLNPILFLVIYIFYKYDKCDLKYLSKKSQKGVCLGFIHGLLQVFSMILITRSAPTLVNFLGTLMSEYVCKIVSLSGIFDWYSVKDLLWLVLVTVIFGGFLGSFIFGIYLLVASNMFCRQSNDAFSAIRSPDYKNFLKICIKNDDTLVIYPVGIKKVPRRGEWNESANNEDNQNEPLVVPSEGTLNPELIEYNIVIKK